jgi:hypothetical protein
VGNCGGGRGNNAIPGRGKLAEERCTMTTPFVRLACIMHPGAFDKKKTRYNIKTNCSISKAKRKKRKEK